MCTILLANSREQERAAISSQLRLMGNDVLEAATSGEAFAWISAKPEYFDMLIVCEKSLDMLLQVKGISKGARKIYTIVAAPLECLDGLARALDRNVIDDFLASPIASAELCLRVMNGRHLLKACVTLENKLNSLKALAKKQTRTIRRHIGAARQTQDEIFLRLYNALESRDMDTANHVYRIGNASACIGGLLGWEASRVEAVRWAAPLHDIGKIGISDAILSKPGPLTSEEFDIIKQHTVKGARILSGSKNRIIRMGKMLALSHHENWDGSGYPYGLKGEKIPLVARVVSVADVYDALLAERVYRKKMTKAQALEIIGNEAGRKFDPAVVEVFMKHNDIIHNHFRGEDNDGEACDSAACLSASIGEVAQSTSPLATLRKRSFPGLSGGFVRAGRMCPR